MGSFVGLYKIVLFKRQGKVWFEQGLIIWEFDFNFGSSSRLEPKLVINLDFGSRRELKLAIIIFPAQYR